MTVEGFVLGRIEEALAASPGPDDIARHSTKTRAAQVLRPTGALQRLDDLAVWMSGWSPGVSSQFTASCLVFASDHGVARQGVSAYPQAVTVAMKSAIEGELATSTALAKVHGASMRLVDVGVGRPTNDFTEMDALDFGRFEQAWMAGAEAVANETSDLVILGELGIGNTTAASAVAAGIIGGSATDWVGRGTGVDDAGLARKIDVVERGLTRLGADASPARVLAGVGGAELVAMAGAAVEARRRSRPLILDGFIATSALLLLHKLSPGFLDHAVAGHRSPEQGHIRMLEWLEKEPILSLEMRLGEASGALVALPILRSAVAAVLDVATFAEAGVPGPE